MHSSFRMPCWKTSNIPVEFDSLKILQEFRKIVLNLLLILFLKASDFDGCGMNLKARHLKFHFKCRAFNTKLMGLLELRCNLIAYDTKTLVGANGRLPPRQRFRDFINSAYHPNSNRPKVI